MHGKRACPVGSAGRKPTAESNKALSFDSMPSAALTVRVTRSSNAGKTARNQRYLCQNTLCAKGSFLLDYCNRGCLPEVKQTIIDMSLNATGVLRYGAIVAYLSQYRFA